MPKSTSGTGSAHAGSLAGEPDIDRRAKQYDCQVCAAAPAGEVAKVFKLTALDTVIPCYQSVGQACEQRFHLSSPPHRAFAEEHVGKPRRNVLLVVMSAGAL